MNAIICRPATFLLRRIVHCPTCERPRQFSGRDAAWYGTTWSCCGCGDSWSDGERHERPFQPGWRAKAITAARRTWIEAITFDPRQHGAWVMGEVAADCDAASPAREVQTVETSGGVL